MNKKRTGTILDIGCNDMYILKALKDRADKLIGIDPILKGKEKKYSKENLVAIGGFFEDVDFNERVDIVICKDTLEHVQNPKQFVKKVTDLGTAETLYFFEFPILETLLHNCRFDQIFHQHLNYFTLQSVLWLLHELGFQLLDITINHKLWGSILIVFKKGRSKRFANLIKPITESDFLYRYQIFKNSMVNTQRQLELLENEVVYGYGAALMLPVLGYHLHNDFSKFICIIDDDVHKRNLYYINLPVQIKRLNQIHDIQKATVLVTAISTITNTRRILAKLADLNPQKIIVPLNTF